MLGQMGDVLLDSWRGRSMVFCSNYTIRYHPQQCTEPLFLLALASARYIARFCSYPLKLARSSI